MHSYPGAFAVRVLASQSLEGGPARYLRVLSSDFCSENKNFKKWLDSLFRKYG